MIKNTLRNQRLQAGRIHPLVATAAVAVTLVSLVGVAAITGVLPNSHGTTAPVVMSSTQAPMMSAMPNEPNNIAVASPSQNYVAAPMPAERVPAPPPVIRHAPQQNVSNTSNIDYADNRPQNYRQDYAQNDVQVAQAPAICNNCGRVESVVAVHHAAPTTGVGIAAGAVLGGVLGNQVGGGNGRTLATVAGAVAGGYGGNEVEKRTHTTTSYQVRVRMENGKVRSFPQSGQDGWRVGDRVRVVNGALTSRG